MKGKKILLLACKLGIILVVAVAFSCISFNGERVVVKAVVLEKINPQYTFVLSPIRAQGASFTPRFGEQATALIRARLQAMSLKVTDFKPGSLTDFAYEVRVSVYEYDYIRKLETAYSAQLGFDIYDSSGAQVVTIMCFAGSAQSVANAMYLDKLVGLCVRELAFAMLKLE